jgi:hypothetical protein
MERNYDVEQDFDGDDIAEIVEISSDGHDVHIEKLLEKVRREEKGKLYPILEEQKKTIADLRRTAEQNDATKNDLAQKMADIEQRILTLQAQAETEKEAISKKAKEAELSAHKERRLRELEQANTGFIPDLIGGNTSEEIDASIEKAQLRYNEIFAQASARQPIANTNRATGTVGSMSSGQPEIVEIDARSITLENWEKVRDDAKRLASQAFKQSLARK